MHPLLITIIIGPQRRVDLQVPGEILAGDLISALLETYGPPVPRTATEPSRWRLGLLHAVTPLPTTSSLLDAGVLDGAVLALGF